jgi:hypothetical protein
MADFMYLIFIIWNYLWILGILCIFLRSDYKEVLIEIFSMPLQNNLFLIIVSGLIIYVCIPLTIPYSMKEIIYNKNNDNDKK